MCCRTRPNGKHHIPELLHSNTYPAISTLKISLPIRRHLFTKLSFHQFLDAQTLTLFVWLSSSLYSIHHMFMNQKNINTWLCKHWHANIVSLPQFRENKATTFPIMTMTYAGSTVHNTFFHAGSCRRHNIAFHHQHKNLCHKQDRVHRR